MTDPHFRTFSGAALAEACPFIYASGTIWAPDAGSDASAGGTLGHQILAQALHGELAAPEDAALRAMVARGAQWLEQHRACGMRAEIAFAYDPETGAGRELTDPEGLEGTRWYADAELRERHGILPGEICGRVDLVSMGVDEEGAFAFVGDWKLHFRPEYEDARAQLEISSLAVARAYGVDRVKAVAIHLWEEIELEEEPYKFDAFALDDIAARVYDYSRPANDPSPLPGPHCKARYCQARAHCPATHEAAEDALTLVAPERLAKGPRLAEAMRAPSLDNDLAAWAVVAADLLEEAAKALRTRAQEFADASGGIVQSDGKLWSGVPQVRATPDLTVPGAVELLQKLGADFAIKESTTWSAIAEIGGKPLEAQAREALAKIGAVKEIVTRPIYTARVVKAGARALAEKRRAG